MSAPITPHPLLLSNLQHSSATSMSFTKFPELPSELRCQIWKEVCHITRVLDLRPIRLQPRDNEDKIKFHTRYGKPPAILHASQEARFVGLQHYKLTFGTHLFKALGGGPLFQSSDLKIYANLRSDIICPVIDLVLQSTAWYQHAPTSFIFRVFSRFHYCRIAIQCDERARFEKVFKPELAYNGAGKEVILFQASAELFSHDPKLERYLLGANGSNLKFIYRPMDWKAPGVQVDSRKMVQLFAEEDILRRSIDEMREKCPMLASSSPAKITPMALVDLNLNSAWNVPC